MGKLCCIGRICSLFLLSGCIDLQETAIKIMNKAGFTTHTLVPGILLAGKLRFIGVKLQNMSEK